MNDTHIVQPPHPPTHPPTHPTPTPPTHTGSDCVHSLWTASHPPALYKHANAVALQLGRTCDHALGVAIGALLYMNRHWVCAGIQQQALAVVRHVQWTMVWLSGAPAGMCIHVCAWCCFQVHCVSVCVYMCVYVCTW